MAEMNGVVVVSGLSEFEEKMKRLRTDNPGFEKRLRIAIRKILGQVRASLQNSAQEGLQMQSDPRHAYKAVRYAVYKRLFGGQVNILNPNRVQKASYNPPRTSRPKQRGGNRMERSSRTQDLLDYYGSSRAFVLRFLNAGTRPRYNGGRNGKTDDERDIFVLNHGGKRFRGSIQQRNWFGPRSHAELEVAAHNLQQLIDRIINDEFV